MRCVEPGHPAGCARGCRFGRTAFRKRHDGVLVHIGLDTESDTGVRKLASGFEGFADSQTASSRSATSLQNDSAFGA